MLNDSSSHPVVLFDGVCSFCNASVRWVINRDPHSRFRFASLQSRAAREALAASGTPPASLDSVVLIQGGEVFTRSDAAIRIARELGFPWSLAAAGLIIPASVRNKLYSWVAANRYRWFGKQSACSVPSPELRARFLDADEHAPAASDSVP